MCQNKFRDIFLDSLVPNKIDSIELCISNVTAKPLHRAAFDMRKRVDKLIAERGEHFQHFI
jgi:hypothetical protein